MMIKKIVSGGQTGVDRAGLDVAIQHNLPHGGWCPRGRRAEDGRISDKYQLVETASHEYAIRTEYNVRDSDGTLILNMGKLEGGTAYTAHLAASLHKPCMIMDLSGPDDTAALLKWLKDNNIQILNIAGPRESKCPGIYEQSVTALTRILSFI